MKNTGYLLLIFLHPSLIFAQWVSVGVTGGVPISPWSQTWPDAALDTRTPMYGPNDLYTKPFAVGPTVDVNLHWNLTIEAGLLYQRLHQDATTGLILAAGEFVSFGYRQDVAGNQWLFPLLLKYNIPRLRFSPFVEAGATLRHLGTLKGQEVQVDYDLNPNPATFRIQTSGDPDTAITLGGGVRRRLLNFDLAPEVRYLHWTSPDFQPARNQAMLMLGITFPARVN
jgi:hypothetical protein